MPSKNANCNQAYRTDFRCLWLIVSVILTWALVLVACVSPKAQYSQLVVTVYPTYDALNSQVLTNLPIPPDTRLLYQVANNGYGYGRRLQVYYATLLNFDDTLSFYTTNLDQAGWKLDKDVFIRGTSCLWIYDSIKADMQLFPIPTPVPSEIAYMIWIWHDFLEQPFSIPTPRDVDVCNGLNDCMRCS